jgi:hypothetical protein
MKVYDFPKLALARCCPLDARQADEKEKGIERGKEKLKEKQREKIYARVMKKTEEVNKEVDVVSLV